MREKHGVLELEQGRLDSGLSFIHVEAGPRNFARLECGRQVGQVHDDAAAVRKLADAQKRIKHEVGRVIVGQSGGSGPPWR